MLCLSTIIQETGNCRFFTLGCAPTVAPSATTCFLKNISESPLFLCGNAENTEHYFMHCRIYEAQRTELSQTVSQYSPFTQKTLLFGNNTLPLDINILIVDAVLNYI